jgi:hypothetical protein
MLSVGASRPFLTTKGHGPDEGVGVECVELEIIDPRGTEGRAVGSGGEREEHVIDLQKIQLQMMHPSLMSECKRQKRKTGFEPATFDVTGQHSILSKTGLEPLTN